MKEPEHLVGPAFKEAVDKIAYLQAQLSETQKAQYEAFLKVQEKEKQEQQEKAARAKAEYDQAKEKQPGAVLNYDPPMRIKDPYLRQKALNAQAEYQKVTKLSMTHLDEKLRFLEKVDQQREDRAKSHDREPRAREDFSRAAIEGKAKSDFEQALTRDPAKSEAIARAIAKVQEQEREQEQQRERDERNEGRERGG